MYWNPILIVNNKRLGEPINGFHLTSSPTKRCGPWKSMSMQIDQFLLLLLLVHYTHAPVMAPERYIKRFSGKMTDKEAAYCGMLENLDENIGRLMAKLRELKIEKETLVILMNDNGGTTGGELYNASMRGLKTTVWPGGTRAFSYWYWPGTLEPRTEGTLTGYVDVFPTLADIAGIRLPDEITQELDGHSMKNLLESANAEFPRDRLLFKHGARWQSGYAQRHKYIQAAVHKGNLMAIRIDSDCPCKEGVCVRGRAIKSGKVNSMVYTKKTESAKFHWALTNGWELYNVKQDPACQNNLAETHKPMLNQLSTSYDQWWDQVLPILIEHGGDAPLSGDEQH